MWWTLQAYCMNVSVLQIQPPGCHNPINVVKSGLVEIDPSVVSKVCKVFGRPLQATVRPMLRDRCLSCLSVCLSVTVVYCGQTVGWIKMPLSTEVPVGLSPSNIVLDGGGTQLPTKRVRSPHFSANVYCGQSAGWIRITLGTEVDLGPDDIVLDGDRAPPPHGKGHSSPPLFSVFLLWPNGRPSQQLLSSCYFQY